MKTLKPLDDVDWNEAADLLVEAFPMASRAEVAARADAAALALDEIGSERTAEAMRRAARNLRKRLLN